MRYETGTKRSVIIEMVYVAIRDQHALIESYRDHNGIPHPGCGEEILKTEALIRDFRKLKRALTGE